MLWVVPTPIGNLQDLSPRASTALTGASLVVAEDTRRTGRLLASLNSHPRMLALPAAREEERVAAVLTALDRGDVALVSDAGTPVISDPGRRLIGAAREAGHEVVSVPGPSAVTAAVAGSGLRADRFAFLGFLPRTRSRQLRLLGSAPELALVFFESPHRLAATLSAAAEVLGDRRVMVAREISKLHESWHLGTCEELAQLFSSHPPLGECTVVVEAPGRRDHG